MNTDERTKLDLSARQDNMDSGLRTIFTSKKQAKILDNEKFLQTLTEIKNHKHEKMVKSVL